MEDKIIPVIQSIKQQEVRVAVGLTSDEAKKRIDKCGFNEIPDQKATISRRIIKQLWGPIPVTMPSTHLMSVVLPAALGSVIPVTW